VSGPIVLCTDSSAQLPPHVAAALGVDLVPVAIALDGDSWDETELDVDLFYDRLRRGARATTSQPSPGRFAQAYARAAERGAEEVLSIHVAGAVSGTVGAAELAAREAPVPVTVVDTGTVSFGVAVCVIAAADALAAGRSAGEAVAAIERLSPTLGNAFVAGKAPGGRVPATEGLPLLSFAGASAEMLGSAESLDHAAVLIAAKVRSQAGQIAVAVGHADRATAASADALANALEHSHRVVELMRYRVGPSVGAHTGPLSFGAFWWPVSGPADPAGPQTFSAWRISLRGWTV
jgi:DegV family protein with EDD domain